MAPLDIAHLTHVYPLPFPAIDSQNKLLLALCDSGELRIEKATQEDREAVAQRAAAEAALMAATKIAQTPRGGSPVTLGDGMEVGDQSGDNLLLDADGNPLPQHENSEQGDMDGQDGGSRSARQRSGRKPKLGPDGLVVRPSQRVPRTKMVLTLQPDGSIRTGGLDGARKPGRPRKATDSSLVSPIKKRPRGRPRGSTTVVADTGDDRSEEEDGQQQHSNSMVVGSHGQQGNVHAHSSALSHNHGHGHGHGQVEDPIVTHVGLNHGGGGGEQLNNPGMSLAQHAAQDEEEDPATAGYLEVNNMESMPDMAEAESSAMALAHMRHMGEDYPSYYQAASPHQQYLEPDDEVAHNTHHPHHHDDGDSNLLDMYQAPHHHNPTDAHFDFPHSDESQVAVGHSIALVSPFPVPVTGINNNTNIGGASSSTTNAKQQQSGPEASMSEVEQAVNAVAASAASVLNEPHGHAGGNGGNKRSANSAGFGGQVGDGGDKRARY